MGTKESMPAASSYVVTAGVRGRREEEQELEGCIEEGQVESAEEGLSMVGCRSAPWTGNASSTPLLQPFPDCAVTDSCTVQ